MLRSLPIERWPRADAIAWAGACQPGKRLPRGGRAGHLKPITRNDLARRYGYFLTYLQQAGAFDADAAAGEQITVKAVERYVDHVQAIWSSVTVANTLYKLLRMGGLLAPGRDWQWLRDLANDLEAQACPKPRFDRIVTSGRLAEIGFAEIAAAHGNARLRTYWRAKRVRDGLMVALLAHDFIRLKNFAALTLGKTFRRVGDRWWIVLQGSDTKSSRPDERPVPKHLNRAVAIYLTYARPTLLGRREFVIHDDEDPGATDLLAGPLWVGTGGAALGYSAVERSIMETTKRVLGRAISPHDFRRNGATTARLHAGNEPHLASALLQHRSEQVTENYNLASSLEAAGRYASLISALQHT